MLLKSYREAFGSSLMARIGNRNDERLQAQELFAADLAVLAHDGAADPRLIYANATALRLWRRSWGEMVGMPSRLTAEREERNGRAKALVQAQQQGALMGYGGTRVDAQGRRFWIEGARLWTLRGQEGEEQGQAARFASWWWLA
ncbi:MAG: MEKHLA domain-containing protein [Cyanobium sp.]